MTTPQILRMKTKRPFTVNEKQSVMRIDKICQRRDEINKKYAMIPSKKLDSDVQFQQQLVTYPDQLKQDQSVEGQEKEKKDIENTEFERIQKIQMKWRKERDMLSLIKVDSTKETENQICLRIMKSLRKNMCDQYEVQANDVEGEGKRNLILCRKVIEKISRWIVVLDVISIRNAKEVELRIFIKRCADFTKRFEIRKSQVRTYKLISSIKKCQPTPADKLRNT